MSAPSLILASASPRRAELLRQIGVSFVASPSNVKEMPPEKSPASLSSYAIRLALQKSREVKKRYPDEVILGADTIVSLEKKVMGKPQTKEEAILMLSQLSGKSHLVVTGIAVLFQRKALTSWSKTKVTFRPLSKEFIEVYVETGDPMDKAGAYGIQGLGALCVERIDGDYFNVVGLPLVKAWDLLAAVGFQRESLISP